MKNKKNRQEFYNSIVRLYKLTGQGTLGIVRPFIEDGVIDSLVKEGLIKIIVNADHEEYFCCTKGYCVEESGMGNMALLYMRIYLGHKDLGLGYSKEQIFKFDGAEDKYEAWVQENKEKLEEIKFIEEI